MGWGINSSVKLKQGRGSRIEDRGMKWSSILDPRCWGASNCDTQSTFMRKHTVIGAALRVQGYGEARQVFSRLYSSISTSLLKTIDRLGRALFVRVGAQEDSMPFVKTDTCPIKTRAILFDYASQNRITHVYVLLFFLD